MSKFVKRSAERLKSRWPFHQRFSMPFPALAFKTKQLVIQVPHSNNGQSYNLSDEVTPVSSARMYKFRKNGAFDVGARRALLRIVPPARVLTRAPIPFFRLPPNPLNQPKGREECSILLKLYLDLTWNDNDQAQFPEQLIITEYGRERPTSAYAFLKMILEMRKGSTDDCLKVEKLSGRRIPLELVKQ
jgi:hypothetical protein